MWKIQTAQIRGKIYYSLISLVLFTEKLKGCRNGTRDTGELLCIVQHILNESKTRQKNLAIAWINNQKWLTVWSPKPGYYTISKRTKYTTKFIEKTMETWRVELGGGKRWAEVKIQRDIFQGDALSSLLFVIAMVPLNHILRKCTARYKLSKS